MVLNNKYSDYKIAWFNDKLKSFVDNEILSPIYVRIKPTNRCNHSCFFCVYNYEFSKMHGDMHRIDEISKDKMFEILDDIKNIGVKAITYSGGGDPLVHRNIKDIIKKTLDLKIDLSMLTNGELLKDEIAEMMIYSKWMRVSMDYCDADMFITSRKGTSERFSTILNNIKIINRKILDNNTGCELGINFIITKDNYIKLREVCSLLIDVGVNNIRFSPLWVPNFYEYHVEIEATVRKQLDMLKQEFNKENNVVVYDSYRIDKSVMDRSYKKCFFMQVTPVIGADCVVYNCHNKAYDKSGIIGSIKDRTFSEMWFSEETKKYFSEFRPDLGCKHQCANDKKNIFIHEIVNGYGDNYV